MCLRVYVFMCLPAIALAFCGAGRLMLSPYTRSDGEFPATAACEPEARTRNRPKCFFSDNML